MFKSAICSFFCSRKILHLCLEVLFCLKFTYFKEIYHFFVKVNMFWSKQFLLAYQLNI